MFGVPVFTIVFIIALILYNIFPTHFSPIREYWSNYMMEPLNYRETGTTPLRFTVRPRYRKPYNFPYMFMTEYPQPYLTYLA